MGLCSMTSYEMQESFGGGLWEKFVKTSIWYEVYKGITDNWEEVKTKFVAGWNIDQPKKK